MLQDLCMIKIKMWRHQEGQTLSINRANTIFAIRKSKLDQCCLQAAQYFNLTPTARSTSQASHEAENFWKIRVDLVKEFKEKIQLLVVATLFQAVSKLELKVKCLLTCFYV